MIKLQPRFDLGVRKLLPEWRGLFTRKDLGADIAAGVTVACIAVPLSLAIALASGVPPAVGLVTAIVAGIVCALFGGTPLQVSGPAAAMAILVAAIVQEQGIAALLVVGVGCGLLQLLTGALGLGRFIRLVPLPVIEGFTAGIGAIILIGQLPRALGLPSPAQSHVFDVVTHIADLASRTLPGAVAITLLTLGVLYGLPKLAPRVPPHLVAVGLSTAVVAAFGLDVATIGEIPRSLPAPRLPALPAGISLASLAGSTLLVFALASLETLLSATAVEKMSPGSARSDPDQELIGQGLGNLACAFFGGIPVTGVIARSGANVQAGAKTRRAAIIHALALLVAVYATASVIERIPIPALAAVLFSVAFRMLSPASFLKLWRHSRADGAVFAVTFMVIVFVDLLEGVRWGVVAALAIAALRLGRPEVLVHGARLDGHYVFALGGPLTFLSSLTIDDMLSRMDMLEGGRRVVFDVRDVRAMDSSGAAMLSGLVEHARALDQRPVIVGLSGEARTQFLSSGGEESVLVSDERELASVLGAPSADARLRTGVERYRVTQKPRYARLFGKLAAGQSPHTLFITCSDSRINPNLITATEPGELFLLRNIGNLVSPVSAAEGTAVGAAIEYAVAILKVSKIVVCGHSSCGAMAAMLSKTPLPAGLDHLHGWIEATQVRALLRSMPSELSVDELAKLNVLAQLDHVRTYPCVAERVASGELTLSGWFFDVASGEVEWWSSEAQRFLPVGEGRERPSLPQRSPSETPRPSRAPGYLPGKVVTT